MLIFPKLWEARCSTDWFENILKTCKPSSDILSRPIIKLMVILCVRKRNYFIKNINIIALICLPLQIAQSLLQTGLKILIWNSWSYFHFRNEKTKVEKSEIIFWRVCGRITFVFYIRIIINTPYNKLCSFCSDQDNPEDKWRMVFRKNKTVQKFLQLMAAENRSRDREPRGYRYKACRNRMGHLPTFSLYKVVHLHSFLSVTDPDIFDSSGQCLVLFLFKKYNYSEEPLWDPALLRWGPSPKLS